MEDNLNHDAGVLSYCALQGHRCRRMPCLVTNALQSVVSCTYIALLPYLCFVVVLPKLWTSARWDRLLPKGWKSASATSANREASVCYMLSYEMHPIRIDPE